MKALYRKYRPLKLSDVIGQDQVVSPLSGSIKNKRIYHSYLFTGPRGCGKTSVARIFAHEINGFDYKLEDSYVDILEIDAASNTGVDHIRELRERAMIAPSVGKYKVYIIDEVHMLSKSAFNALLKILEEPPAHVVFIMATTEAYKIPVTISSRSQNYIFHLAEPKVMFDYLKTIAKKESIKIDDSALELIVARGGGSFRDSISLLDQISTLKSETITEDDIISILGLPAEKTLEKILSAYESADLASITSTLAEQLNTGIKPSILATDLINYIVAHPTSVRLSLLSSLTSVSGQFADAKLLLALTKNLLAYPQPPKAPFAQSAAIESKPAQSPTTQSEPTQPPTSKAIPEEKPDEPAQTNATPAQASATPPQSFNPTSYIAQFTSNLLLQNILKDSSFAQSGSQITIAPKRKVQVNILNSNQNKKLLLQYLPNGFNLRIAQPDSISPTDRLATTPSSASKISPSTFSNISSIMGEVEPYPDNPF